MYCTCMNTHMCTPAKVWVLQERKFCSFLLEELVVFVGDVFPEQSCKECEVIVLVNVSG